MRATYLRALRLGSVLTIPVGVGLACLAAPMTDVLFGQKWHGAVLPMAILASTLPQQVVVVSTGPIYIALGETRMWRKRTTPTYLTMMVCLVVGAFFGATGVAVAFATVSYGFCYYAASQPWGLLGISVIEVVRMLRPQLLAALIMGAAIVGARQLTLGMPPWVWLVGGVALGVVVYLAALTMLDRSVVRQWLAELRRQPDAPENLPSVRESPGPRVVAGLISARTRKSQRTRCCPGLPHARDTGLRSSA